MAKIVIIGGGVAGLSAGIYAQRQGHQAIVCEQHTTAGGNLTGWQRGDYHIDNCIHWLTGTNPATDTYKLWVELGVLGGDVEVYQGESLYTCEYHGQRLSLWKDLDRLHRELLKISPEDEEETERLIRTVKAIQGIMGIGGRYHNKKSSPARKLVVLPELLHYHRLSTGDLADQFTHPLIRQFLTAVMGSHFSAIALLIVMATFCGENGGIPKGSSCAMAKRMTEHFLNLGGLLLLNKTAVKIHCSGGLARGVSFSDGSNLLADYVISAIDPASLFGTLLPVKMPAALAKQYKQKQLQRFSGYHCAFACDSDDPPFRGDFIFPVPLRRRGLVHGDQVILREFSHEKSFAPAGHSILQATVFCNEKEACKSICLHENKEKYQQQKRQLSAAIQAMITEQFPSLCGRLHCIDVWTPATYHRYTGAETGSFMSFTMPPKKLPHHLSNRVPHLRNVILATQWLQSPGGLPIAAGEGKRAIETIAKLEKHA